MVKSFTSTPQSSLTRTDRERTDNHPSAGQPENAHPEAVVERNLDLSLPEPPDVSHLITEDDTPVDNFASAKQQRLLVSSLYSARPDLTFLAEANVGIFYHSNQPAIVPDVFVSYDVQVPDDWWKKNNRSYMVWNFGKAPEIVVEIVSNKVGGELTDKLNIYSKHLGAAYYVVYDPSYQLGKDILHIFELRGNVYTPLPKPWFGTINLGVTTWHGEFEGRTDSWLRWCDADGNILLTGDELAQQEQERANQEQQRANQEQQRADQEQQRADQEQQRANQEQQRADRLAEFLRSQGIDPDHLPG